MIRVHRQWMSVSRLEAMQTVRLALAARGLPFIKPIATPAGPHWMRWRNHLVELEHRVGGENMTSWERLVGGMQLLGRIHGHLAALSSPAAARVAAVTNQIPVEEVTTSARASLAAVTLWPDATGAEIQFAQMTDQHATTLSSAWRPYEGRLPRQLVHGDFWDNNVLFDGDRVVAVLDLDFMAERDRIDDLALILYYVNSGDTLPDRLRIDERRLRLRELVDAYDSSADPRLEPIERQALPLALARMMLKHTRHLIQRSDPSEQRKVLVAELAELDWSRAIIRELPDWQAAFA